MIEADAFDTEPDAEAPATPQQSSRVNEAQTPAEVETREAGTDAEIAYGVEAPDKPPQSPSVSEVQTPAKKETREAGTDAETAVESGAASESTGGTAVLPATSVGATRDVGEGELSNPPAEAARNEGHGVGEKLPKAEGAALAEAVENRKGADVQSKNSDDTGGPHSSSAAGLVSNTPASSSPREVLHDPKPEVHTLEKALASNGPEQALSAQPTPAQDGSTKPLSVAAKDEAKDEAPASETQPIEPMQKIVPIKVPIPLADEADQPKEIEPPASSSSPVLKAKAAPVGSPLSWSDEDEMKLARHSYGSQGLAGIGAAPMHGVGEPGAFESDDLPLKAAAGTVPMDSPFAAEGAGGVGHAGDVVKDQQSGEAEKGAEGKSQQAEHGKGPFKAERGSADEMATKKLSVTEQETEPGSGAVVAKSPVNVGASSGPTDIDELWRVTKERLFSLPPRVKSAGQGAAANGRDQEVASDVAEAGSENSRKGAASEASLAETGASRGSDAASNVSVAGSSMESAKTGSNSGVQAVLPPAVASKVPALETVAAGALAAITGEV